MKKTTKWTMTAMVLLFVAAIATSAFGWGRGPGFGGGSCAGFVGYPGLNLTADQKVQLEALRAEQIKATESLRTQMFAKRDALRALWLEATPDQAKIQAAQNEMRTLRDQLQEINTAFRLDALKVLTPEQKAQLKTNAAGRGFGRGRGFGPGAGPGAAAGPGACADCPAGNR
ncbi:MAG: Spy/CpxP family protein refolding chaperone [Syntrophales bacterium]